MKLPFTMSGKGHTRMDTPLYTLKQVAEKLGVHPQTLKHHIYNTKKLEGIGKVFGRALVFDEAGIEQIKKILASQPSRGNSTLSHGDVKERQDQALKLREAGKSFQEIADALGFGDNSGAVRAVQAAEKRAGQKRK